jgi:hypothetical protein
VFCFAFCGIGFWRFLLKTSSNSETLSLAMSNLMSPPKESFKAMLSGRGL